MLTLTGERYTYEWRLGKPFVPPDYIPWGGAYVYINAEGQELGFLREHFSNIPMTDGLRVQWTDEGTVRFLVDNLRILTAKQRKKVA